MLMALCLASLLLFTGQISTQMRQPVQSSGATCSVYSSCSMPRHFGLALLKVAGAALSMRCRRPWRGSLHAGRPARTCRTGCRVPRPTPESSGQYCASPTCAVPVGNVPPGGSALTGSSIAAAGSHRAQNVVHERRSLAGIIGRMSNVAVTFSGSLHWMQMRKRGIDGRDSSAAPPRHRACRRSSESPS